MMVSERRNVHIILQEDEPTFDVEYQVDCKNARNMILACHRIKISFNCLVTLQPFARRKKEEEKKEVEEEPEEDTSSKKDKKKKDKKDKKKKKKTKKDDIEHPDEPPPDPPQPAKQPLSRQLSKYCCKTTCGSGLIYIQSGFILVSVKKQKCKTLVKFYR